MLRYGPNEAIVLRMTTNLIATYTETGIIRIGGGDIDAYDADGGTWEDEVRGVLRRHGYTPVGEWSTDALGDSSIVVELDA